jgi:glucose-1-phosphate adenylyltransferase
MILPNVAIGSGCTITRAIVDEGCEVPEGTAIGVDREADARRFHVTEKGVVLVTPDMLRGPRGP